MSDLAISQNAIIPGSTVKHPAYGTGKVVTVGYDWRRRVVGAEVEFVVRDLPRKLLCKARDLTPVEPERPALRVVYSRDGVGAAS